LDVCSNRGAKHEIGGTDFKWEAGHHWSPAGDGPAIGLTLINAKEFIAKKQNTKWYSRETEGKQGDCYTDW